MSSAFLFLSSLIVLPQNIYGFPQVGLCSASLLRREQVWGWEPHTQACSVPHGLGRGGRQGADLQMDQGTVSSKQLLPKSALS